MVMMMMVVMMMMTTTMVMVNIAGGDFGIDFDGGELFLNLRCSWSVNNEDGDDDDDDDNVGDEEFYWVSVMIMMNI